jgi:hypothetical protein
MLPRAIAAVLLCAACSAHAVQVGQARGAVIAELGKPTSTLEVGSREVLTFPRGDVTLVNGVVTEVRLRTEAEQEALLRARAAAAEQEARIAREREAARAAREAAMLADPALLARPAEDQLRVWRNAIETGRVAITSPAVRDRVALLAEQVRVEREAAAQRARDAAGSMGGVIPPVRLSSSGSARQHLPLPGASTAPVFPNTLEQVLRDRAPILVFRPGGGTATGPARLTVRTSLRALGER